MARAGEDQLRLPRPPGAVRRFLADHPRVPDWTAVVVSLLLGWALTDRFGLLGSPWEVLGGPWILVNVVTAAALLLRRSRPLLVLGIAVVGDLLMLVDPNGPLIVPLAVGVYSAAVYRSNRAAAAGAAAVVIALVAMEVWLGLDGGRMWFIAIIAVLIALVLGTSIGDRRRYLAALLERAAQLATERDQRARLAVVAERARIARELHDVVAHGLSVIVRLSDGADAVAATDPERSRKAVRQVGRIGRDSLQDMRRLLGVLSEAEPEPQLAPQPSLADLDALVETYRAAGLPVVVERVGGTDLDAAAQLVVYRVVQEGLTNALRYAQLPTRVLVRLRVADRVEVEVADDGRGSGRTPSVGLGSGLLGLRERLGLYGGEVEAGPRDDLGGYGWRVRVRFTPDAPRTEEIA